MNDYLFVIPGTNFRVLDNDTINIAKSMAGRNGQSGIKYVEDSNMVVMTSSDMHDILHSAKVQCWAHTSRPVRVQKGWEVLIVPTNQLQDEYGRASIGMSFIATGEAFETDCNEYHWPSNSNAQPTFNSAAFSNALGSLQVAIGELQKSVK